ncbi:hypothetical protein F2981_32720 (plasmid) [Sinorhizobium meliloti]|nr:hypothetical protein [Sinorhizobium meliloti]
MSGTYDPFNTDIIAKAKASPPDFHRGASNTPWVKFRGGRSRPASGPTFQSLPALMSTSSRQLRSVPETTPPASGRSR